MSLTHPQTASARTAVLLIACIVLSPLMLFIAAELYTAVVPAYSATLYIKELDTSLDLRFYWVWNEANGNGRYLTARTPRGRVTENVCGWDWAHWGRTSVYLTPDGRIAVLGPDRCDYLVTIDPPELTYPFRLASEDWTYLGAFDFVESRSGRHLRFVRATEQPECVLRGSDTEPQRPLFEKHRESTRRVSCPLAVDG